MNAFERRREARRVKRKLRARSSNFVKLLEIDYVQKRYEDAWYAMHGTRVRLAYKHGRYWVLGRCYLLSELLEMANMLDAILHERTLNGELNDNA